MFEGVKCGLIYPLLEQEAVATRTVNAILQDEGEVSIPWSAGCLVHMGKAFYPSCIVDRLSYILVGWNAMLCDFKGR